MIKNFFLMIALSTLTGCFFSTPDSRFYLLEATAKNELSSKKLNLAVQDIFVPAYIDRPQIVLQRPDSAELTISEFNRWGSDLNNMLQTTLIDNLQQMLPQAVIKPLAYGNSPRYIIKVNIEKISGWLGQNAELIGNWQLLNRWGSIIAEQDFQYSHPVAKTYDSYVQTQSLMWEQAAHDIADRLITLK